MYDDTLRILSQHGYTQYEISNFAKPGYECQHNIGYWTQIPYLGLGCAASSMLPDMTKKSKYLRIANPPLLDDYLCMTQQHDWLKRETEQISPADAQFETLMLGLRMTRGVSEAKYSAMHAEPLDKRYGHTLQRIEQQGLMEHVNGFWRLTRRGMDVQNAVLVELMEV